mmetsp:Transcript_870/g.1932  ORF Transcript_870/g.1932 Transcript_870/m.1932 type:complete len:91 (+) Transcript_870:39-311(+)
MYACLHATIKDILVDGFKRTPPAELTRGVKQGCPLSPLLFALYVNHMDRVFDGGVLGAVTGTGGRRISLMLHADDLPYVFVPMTQHTCGI